jgi:hypothetical protein
MPPPEEYLGMRELVKLEGIFGVRRGKREREEGQRKEKSGRERGLLWQSRRPF